MNRYLITILVACLLVSACETRTDKIDQAIVTDTVFSGKNKTDSVVIPSFDTTILLKDLKTSTYSGRSLTGDYAKKILYAHFVKKGCYTADNLPDMSDMDKLSEADQMKRSVHYDTIFTADLNHSKSMDAVITYWLTPLYANGNNWRPHKAILIDTEKGYKITNEEFIPDYYIIDSVITQNREVIIYGYEFDRGTRKASRNFRITIK
ncbi:MAG: hypothetical protein K0R51_1116 [Cytophagaceae bacterium]|jgi:hypothetical protein|nr:hypothetical protein [Cytophagaceae bacterium]